MNRFFYLMILLFLMPHFLHASDLHKLNYLPKQFLQIRSQLEQQKKSTIKSEKEIRWNQSELQKYSLIHGKQIFKNFLVGAELGYELFSGIDLMRGTFSDQESRGQGISQFGLWSLYRLREQTEGRGLWDFNLNLYPALGEAIVDNKFSNRYSGRSGLSSSLSNGYLIPPWEFRLSFFWDYFSSGSVKDRLLNQKLTITPFYKYGIRFSTQYSLSTKRHLLLDVGFLQESIQTFKTVSEKRELQLGSRSIFGLSMREKISTTQLIQLGISTSTGEYYVKKRESIEGDQFMNTLNLSWMMEY